MISLYLPFPLVVDLCPAVVWIEDRTDMQRNRQPVRLHTGHRSGHDAGCNAKHAGNVLAPRLLVVPSLLPTISVPCSTARAEILLQDYFVFDLTDPNDLFSRSGSQSRFQSRSADAGGEASKVCCAYAPQQAFEMYH